MANSDSAFESFRAALSPAGRLLLEGLAHQMGAVLSGKLRGKFDLALLTHAVATAMPFLTAEEARAMTLCGAAQMQEAQGPILQVQMAMQRENQIYTTVSNVLKTRHDTVKNSISNVR